MIQNRNIQEVIRGSFASLIIRAIGAILALLFNIMLARKLDVEEVGLYYLSLGIILFASVIGKKGLDGALVKIISGAKSISDYSLINGSSKKAIKSTILTSLIITIILISLAPIISIYLFEEKSLVNVLQIMALAVIPLSISMIYGEMLRGMKLIAQSQIVLTCIIPVILVIIVASKENLEVSNVAFIYVFAAIACLFIGWILWRISTEDILRKYNNVCSPEINNLSKDIFIISLVNVVLNWIGTFILGYFDSAIDIALFNIANRIASSLSIFLVSINAILGPKLSEIYKKGNAKELENISKFSTKIMAIIILPFFILFTFFPENILLIFGEKYLEAKLTLQIISFGVFFNGVMGSLGTLLIMSDNSDVLRKITILTGVVTVFLNMVLVPFIGLTGAAIAYTLTLVVRNIISCVFVKKILGFYIFPVLGKKSEFN